MWMTVLDAKVGLHVIGWRVCGGGDSTICTEVIVGIIGRSDGNTGMLDNPCMLGNPAPGVTARILYLLLFFIPIAIQKSLLLLSPVRSYNAEPTVIVTSFLCCPLVIHSYNNLYSVCKHKTNVDPVTSRTQTEHNLPRVHLQPPVTDELPYTGAEHHG
ncbi:hypothetical protein M011DRAFT_145603 [Sporormia fimetaria CBS 119925]|uniref:Uncharacterized protein n=1 Tax=Sporormia fimetaria CBS 119925 TaxID=1340428 RepID=A0A6A6V4C7_9PLEO|nr:hypothetical protein M011DRAFT_145603 [Sporormia fimetaria CBS 119925]